MIEACIDCMQKPLFCFSTVVVIVAAVISIFHKSIHTGIVGTMAIGGIVISTVALLDEPVSPALTSLYASGMVLLVWRAIRWKRLKVVKRE